MLYEISFRAQCIISTQHTQLGLRVRVDGHLIVVGYLSSSMASDSGMNGVYMVSNGQTHGSVFQWSKTDWIYLSAGVHSIDCRYSDKRNSSCRRWLFEGQTDPVR